MTPIEVYRTYLAFKNHFTKKNYDYFKYCGKTNASKDAFNKRKDRYFFERMSRKKNDEEIKHYFLANFVECDDPDALWIGDIIRNGNEYHSSWLKRFQGLTYLFENESMFISKNNFEDLFSIKGHSHPEILKRYLQGNISIESMVILDVMLNYSKKFDKKLLDPVWETVGMKIQKYKPFLNINVDKFKKILLERLK